MTDQLKDITSANYALVTTLVLILDTTNDSLVDS